MTKTLLLRFESKTGKHWAELHEDQWGCTYDSPNAHGSYGNLSQDAAIREFTAKVESGYFLPDAAKTPMRQVYPA